jgi:uncharacterized NAD(P)/FAD-binding protein YdhS
MAEALPEQRVERRANAATARSLLKSVRERATRTGDWRRVMDSLRPVTAQLWHELPLAERRRFLRHLSSLWDIHRHRMAPQIARWLELLLKEERLSVLPGSIQELGFARQGVSVRYLPRGEHEPRTLRVGRVINCMGLGPLPTRGSAGLLGSLLQSGLVCPGPLGLGLLVSHEGRVFDEQGSFARPLFAVGPMRREALWESIAVPEIRAQAEALAPHLLA